LREDVPFDDLASNIAKAARITHCFDVLRSRVRAKGTDVLVIFGDDQLERFSFANFPAISVFVGGGPLVPLRPEDRIATDGRSLEGHPELASHLTSSLMRSGIDPAFAMDNESETGIGHAFVRPALSLTNLELPIVPIALNCYYAPQITAKRCFELGIAVRTAIESFPEDLQVAVVASGGLWHTPGAKYAYLDEAFDHEVLRFLGEGNARALAEFFDGYVVPEGDVSQGNRMRSEITTGMPNSRGPQGGTREICNWIATAAAVDGCPATVIDYVPIYASPVGAGFVVWDF
jgi:hypothetical protein